MQALLRHIRRARRGDPTAVHQARVASRRLRETVPVTGGVADGHVDPGKDIRRITRALGLVREMDVSRSEFERDAARHDWPPAAVAHLRDHLAAERERRVRDKRAKLDRVDMDRLEDRIEALASACETEPSVAWQRAVGARARKRAQRFGKALRAAGTIYAPEALHATRIAGKKLRYALEVARGALGAPVGRDIGALERLQDLLGRLHDLQVLQDHLRAIAPENRGLRDGMAAIERELDAECRMLHARFLTHVDRLHRLADRVGALAPALLAPRRMSRMRTADGRRPSRRRALA
jgi:CHAD domain-containing protein